MQAIANTPLFKILSTCRGGGYRYCRTEPPHPKRNALGLYPLHRVVLENKIGRLLAPGEIAHHLDENKENNDPANIALMTNADHSREHARERAVSPVPVHCGLCGAAFLVKPNEFRLRSKRTATGELFCSRSCGAKSRPRS